MPFGIQMPTSRLNADQQPAAPFGRLPPQPRYMTASERLQSQSFADGLGRRLLSMIGIDTASNQTDNNNNENNGQQDPHDTMRALQNLTVLQQLNKGVSSIYGGLSRMYNSTIQEQLNLLQERFKAETANSTNPWHQRMAQQVPQFFKQMANKVSEAQDQLNKVWRDANNVTLSSKLLMNDSQPQSRSSSFGLPFFDQSPNEMGGLSNFFHQIGRSFGLPGANGEQNTPSDQQPGLNNLANHVRQFWLTQVQPQVNMVRGQLGQVWREMAASGVLTPDAILRSRFGGNNLGSSSTNSSTDLVNDILKEIDVDSPEYTLVESKSDGEHSGEVNQNDQTNSNGTMLVPKLSPQMQNNLVNVQREVNQLWMGLTSSLQGALNNVRMALNPRPRFAAIEAMPSNNQPQQVNAAENEIDSKLKELSKLQRDADLVHDAVQQQQREAQQRQTFGERFRGLFSNADLGGIDQLPNRIGESVSRFGNVVGDLWNQIPGRWDSFVHNMRPQQRSKDTNAHLTASSTTSTTQKPEPEIQV